MADDPGARAFRPSVRLTAAVLVIVVAAVLMEGAARLVYHYRDDVRAASPLSRLLARGLVLDPYEMPSPDGGYHWVLRPGYATPLSGVLEQKRKSGREQGAKALGAVIGTGGADGPAILRINADGFKGPELDRTGARPRILAVGDSTTFGLGAVDYPRALEAALAGRGLAAEVVNGGVEGYSPRNVLLEMDRYAALKPALAIVYIGWNALYTDVPWPDALENRLRSVWLVKRAGWMLASLFADPQAEARRLYHRKAKTEPGAPAVTALRDYVPPAVDNVAEIVDRLKATGARVAVVTLPGLFATSTVPTARALDIGHLPHFTENPFVLAKLTERYNAALRRLAEDKSVQLIDLEAWSVEAFAPRDAYFTDSVHLTPKALNMIGVYMAESLASTVSELRKP